MARSTKQASAAPEFVTELPPDGRANGVYDFAPALKERPGEWALVATKGSTGAAGSMAANIRRGFASGCGPMGSFEAKSRHVDGEYRVYARYIGDA